MTKGIYYLQSGNKKLEVSKGIYLTVLARSKKEKIEQLKDDHSQTSTCHSDSPKSIIFSGSNTSTKKIYKTSKLSRSSNRKTKTKILRSSRKNCPANLTSSISFLNSMVEQYPIYEDRDLFPLQISQFHIPMTMDYDCDSDIQQIQQQKSLLSYSLTMAIIDHRKQYQSSLIEY